MGKRYRKMAKKANGKILEILDGQVVFELPLSSDMGRFSIYIHCLFSIILLQPFKLRSPVPYFSSD